MLLGSTGQIRTDATRTWSAGGFDGMALYDPYVPPSIWSSPAREFSSAQLFFSFNVNAGFDHFPERPPFGDCFSPFRFEPPLSSTGWDAAGRAEAIGASRDRILTR
jgi:hypothetical protein